jgi:hypothetical protein
VKNLRFLTTLVPRRYMTATCLMWPQITLYKGNLRHIMATSLYSQQLLFKINYNYRETIIIHPLNDTRTPPNWYAYTPYPNKLRSFHFKVEYHVCLTCLHLSRENNTTRLTPRIYLTQEPAIVERRRGRPIGSINISIITNCVDRSARREPSAFEQNTHRAQSWARGRGRGYRRGHGHRGSSQTSSRGSST